jgi:hypothetical protein
VGCFGDSAAGDLAGLPENWASGFGDGAGEPPSMSGDCGRFKSFALVSHAAGASVEQRA